ncbi:hypothetical protein LCGC14_0722880 [marine sediment metagenome]|uniref:Uncharacterized protein n=1 Tax=marine sediment metagenome TaxID=412755 RepID=A0A0F9QG18_9ZZZZ
MNVYFVNAGEVTTYDCIDREAGLYVPEEGCLVELVAAWTRKQAIYTMWKAHKHDLGDLTDQRWITMCIAKRVDRPRGILPPNDPLWRSPKFCGPEEEVA